jgi:3-oxoacyl-[acyl-carrier-protein] synthase II
VTSAVAITGAGVLLPAGGDPPGADVPVALRDRIGRVERLSALALLAGRQALVDAALDGPPRDGAGVVIGTALGCFLTNAEYQQRVAAGGVAAASPRLFAATVSNAAAGELAIAFGLAGPGITLSAGAASGTTALGHAAQVLDGGGVEVLLAGGVDAAGAAVDAFVGAGGLAVGVPVRDGAALLVLESLAGARARGARVRGVLTGWGAGFAPEPAAPDAGVPLADAMRMACGAGGGSPAAIAVAAPPAVGAMVEQAVNLLGLGAARRLAFDPRLGHSLGAAGPAMVMRVLDSEAPGTSVLVVDACASGHVAALAVRVGGGA